MMTYIVEGINIDNLLKARNKFEEFRLQLNSEQEKAGAIQAFHYCFELAWKTLKRIIEKSGRDCYYQKDVFREAMIAQLISDPKCWFEFTSLRNLIIHTYNENNLETVTASFDKFSHALSELVENLKKRADVRS